MTRISNSKQKKIALFGGAFDPPHVGHALAIRQILDTAQFDEVWVIPTGTRPDKKTVAGGQERLAMVSLLIETMFSEEPVYPKDHLIHGDKALPTTFDELRYLQQQYPSLAFCIAIGRDQALVLQNWHRFAELRQLAHFLILVRDGRPIPEQLPADTQVIAADTATWMNCSSTDIRNRIAKNKPISGLVPPVIQRYITKRQLYTTRKEST